MHCRICLKIQSLEIVKLKHASFFVFILFYIPIQILSLYCLDCLSVRITLAIPSLKSLRNATSLFLSNARFPFPSSQYSIIMNLSQPCCCYVLFAFNIYIHEGCHKCPLTGMDQEGRKQLLTGCTICAYQYVRLFHVHSVYSSWLRKATLETVEKP